MFSIKTQLRRFLAMLMAILLLPVGAVVSGNRRDFQAGAQTGIISCNGAGSAAIIKKPCGDGSTSPQEIVAFETETVNAWLAAHELPLDGKVYQYGRTNLRNELRAYILASIVAIIRKPAADRTPREQVVYQWLQSNVQKLDVQLYQSAIAEWNTYKSDQCNYILDADVVRNYGIQYDGTPFCYAQSSLSDAFSFHDVPVPDYFLAVGLKKSYGAALGAGDQRGSAISYALKNEISNVRALSAAVGLAAGGATAVAVAATAASIFPFTLGVAAAAAQGITISGATTAYVATVSSTASLTTSLATAGAGAVIALAVIIGIQAGIKAVTNQQMIDQLNALGKTLATAQATPPDLATYLNDDQGRYKLNAAFVIQTLPDTPYTGELPPHQPGTDPAIAILPEGGAGVGDSAESATFQDWNKNKVSIATVGGYFAQTVTSAKDGSQADSMTPTMHYLDWEGNQMTASRRGAKFLVLRNGSDKPACPADTTTSLSVQSPDTCSSYVADVLQVIDKDGKHVSIRIGGLPVFTSPSRFSTPVGTSATAAVSVTSGGPLSEFKLLGNAPAGITIAPNGSNTLQVKFGGSTEPRGDTLIFSATNAFGTTTQTVIFSSYGQLQFTSIPTIEASGGSSVNYKVTTNAGSSAAITSSGLDQIGLTLRDNHDGTATIAGIVNWPALNTTSATCQITDFDGLCPIEVSATNGSKNITSPVPHKIPVALISLDSHQDKDLGYLPPGQPASFELSSAFCFNCSVTYTGQLPAGLTLSKTVDSGGILRLTGTPAVGSEGDYSVMITIAAPYKDTIALKLSVGVPQPPVFTNPQVAVLYLTKPSTFTIRAVGTPAPTLVAGWLPDWLTFETQQQASSVTGRLSGKPPYFPGPFSLWFKASSASGEKEQTIAVFVRLFEGDLNNDGVVNCADQQYLKNVLRYFTVNPGYDWTADVNMDGLVNIEDLTALGHLLPGNPVCH